MNDGPSSNALLAFRVDVLPLSLSGWLLLVLAAAAAVTGLAAGYRWYLWAPALATAAVAALFLLTALFRRADRYTVSGQRIEVERGLLARRVENIDLWRVRDVVLDQSLLDRMRRTGTLTIYSSDQVEPVFAVGPVPEARYAFEKLRDAVAQARKDAGVVRVDR
jgi:membrane protein YdbS with pleckstrin-like domain